jgi:hypothetical protein
MAAPGGGIWGAAKFIWSPAVVIVPNGELPFTMPFRNPSVELHVGLLLTYQNTEILPPPETVGVQTSELPAATVCDGRPCEFKHVIALIAAGGRIVMVVVATRLVCAWASAVMVTIPLLVVGTIAGAVYRPFVSIVPTVELPLVMVLTSQVATVLLRFAMDAVHCEVAFAFMEVLAQLIEIVGTAAGVLAPQEFKTSSQQRRKKGKD